MNTLKGANVKDQKQLRHEFFQYGVLPSWWIPVSFKDTEIIQAIAMSNNLDMSAADEIENNINKYVNASTKNKIVGRLGKMAVHIFYGFHLDRLFSKDRGSIDFIVSGKNITVKSSSFIKSEVVIISKSMIIDDHGTDIFIGVNVDFDEKNIMATTAYITGWITKYSFKKKCFHADDIKGDLLFVKLSELCACNSLKAYLNLLKG